MTEAVAMSGIEEGRITEAKCAAFRGQLAEWVGCLRAGGADRQAIQEEIVGTYWDCPHLMRCAPRVRQHAIQFVEAVLEQVLDQRNS
jgi:hypothetical protein